MSQKRFILLVLLVSSVMTVNVALNTNLVSNVTNKTQPVSYEKSHFKTYQPYSKQHGAIEVQINEPGFQIPTSASSELTQNTPVVHSAHPFILDQVTTTTFVSWWDTTLTSSGSSNTTQVKLPLQGSGTYDFVVDWGDGSSNTILSSNYTLAMHNYAISGTYSITLDGLVVGFSFNGGGDRLKLLEISQWGNLRLGNTGTYFSGASNLILTTTDTLDLNGTTSFYAMFANAISISTSGNLNSWNTSQITNMMAMFNGATAFNQPLNNWNTSSVTNMRAMFSGATSFNQNINSWDTSAVTQMTGLFSEGLFYHASSFNQPLDNWDVSKLTSLAGMFNGATAFNQDLNTWNTSGIVSTRDMFYSAKAFNGSINDWDVSHVTSMQTMFYFTDSFNQPLDKWNTSSVTNMQGLFVGSSAFNQNIDNWDTSQVTDMSMMFQISVFNQPIGSWDVSRVQNMYSMFGFASAFNQPIGNWNVSNVQSVGGMFYSANNFNQSLNNWNLTKVTSMYQMFMYAYSFNQPLNKWNMTHVTDIRSMFTSASSFNQPLDQWDVSHVTQMSGLFDRAGSFNQPLNSWNTSSVVDMASMFISASSFNQPLYNWDTSQVTTMRNMFRSATSFNQPIGMWNTSNVLNMDYMFYDNSYYNGMTFDQPLGNWDVSNITTMINILTGVTLSPSNYDDLLNGWSQQTLNTGVQLDAPNCYYTDNATAARDIILAAGWTINDNGMLFIDTIPPVIDAPADISFSEGSYQFITWTVSDNFSPSTYVVENNDTIFEQGIWGNGTIQVDISNLVMGTYNFTIYIFDTNTNMASDTVIVTVYDNTEPTLDHPRDITYTFGSVGNYITWNAYDLHKNKVFIEKNGVEVYSNDWQSGQISIGVDDLDIGTYNFTITVYDLSGNYFSDTVIVTVVPRDTSNPPTTTYPPDPVSSSTNNPDENSSGDNTSPELSLPINMSVFITTMMLLTFFSFYRRKRYNNRI